MDILDTTESSDGDSLNYLMKITTMPNSQCTFMIKDRYSVLRVFQEDVVKLVFPLKTDQPGLPPFPGKKFIGGNDPKFLEQRKQQLQVFFNEFLKNEKILANAKDKIFEYFMESAIDNTERSKIRELQSANGPTSSTSSSTQNSKGLEIIKSGMVKKQSR